MEGGEGCTNSHSSWTQLKNRKKKKSGTEFVFYSLTKPPAWLMIQPQPAWVQHNNNKSLFCTEQWKWDFCACLLKSVREKSGKKKICFSYDRMDSYSLYLNDKSVSLFERMLFRSHHGAATDDLVLRSTLNGINYWSIGRRLLWKSELLFASFVFASGT